MKTRHGPHKFLLKAIPLINDIAGRLVSIEILYVGATLKHCFLFIKVSKFFLDYMHSNINKHIFLKLNISEISTTRIRTSMEYS